MHHRFLILAATTLLVAASEPPADVPVPQEKPKQENVAPAPSENAVQEKEAQPPAENSIPKPEQKPDSAQPSENAEPQIEKPVEQSRPEKPEPEPVKDEDPEQLNACLTALKDIGAEFRQIEPIKSEEDGCGIASPIELSAVLPEIKLEPAGTMRCETALALSRWTREMMLPAAKIALPDRKVTGIANASTYICRNRNSTENGKISEHAKGNAVDISTIAFDKGEPLVMKPRAEDGTPEGAFQRTITAAACLFFRTVLSPGSDATHQDHLHLDVLERKGGFLYCR